MLTGILDAASVRYRIEPPKKSTDAVTGAGVTYSSKPIPRVHGVHVKFSFGARGHSLGILLLNISRHRQVTNASSTRQ